MPLPINKTTNEISYHNFKMYDEQVIRVRNYRIADIESYIKRVGKRDNSRTNEKAAYDLLKSCTHPEDLDILESLDRINIIYLLICLRVHSVAGTIPYPHECPECKTANVEYRLDIVPNIVKKYTPVRKVQFSERFELTLRNIPYSKELELSQIPDDDERAKYELYYRVKSIRNDDEIYENFSVEEFNDWLNSEPDEFHMTNDQFLLFLDELDKADDSISLQTQETCLACGHKLNIKYDNFSFFITA
jgi:hypothetical protein